MKRLIVALALVLPLAGQQVTPPPPAAPREAKLPKPVEKTLANGLRVIVVPKHDIPLVAARLLFKTGGAADLAAKDGLAQLVSAVVTQGTKSRGAKEISRGVEALGATLTAGAGWDESSIDLSVMSANLPKAMTYLADVARNATFAETEFERERAQTIDALQVNLGEPRALAAAVISRLIFGEAPYGHNLQGTLASLAKITRADLPKFYATHYRPDNAVLVLAGDVKAEDAFKLAQTQLGSWSRGTSGSARATVRLETKPSAPSPRVVVIDMPDAGQSAVAVGRTGIRRSDAASYMTAIVANSVLGAGYSSRLNQEIRIRRGLAYGAGSSFDARAEAGPFLARTETKHETAAEVVSIIVGELNRLSAADVEESELTPRKATLIGGFGQSLETTSGIVNRVSTLALYGLPLSEINRYVGGVQSVTAAQVRKFAASNLGGKDAHVVIVGDAKLFLEPLRKQFSKIEVIPVAELDLGSAKLRVHKEKK